MDVTAVICSHSLPTEIDMFLFVELKRNKPIGGIDGKIDNLSVQTSDFFATQFVYRPPFLSKSKIL